jgi:hypothetical protein
VHGDIALSAGTHDRRKQPRLSRVLDVVGVEAVIVADEDMLAAEGEIRVGVAQRVRVLLSRGFARHWRSRRRFRRRVGGPLGRRRITGRRLGIEEALRLWHAGHKFHVARRDTGVAQACLQANPRIRRWRRSGTVLRATVEGDGQHDSGETQNARRK